MLNDTSLMLPERTSQYQKAKKLSEKNIFPYIKDKITLQQLWKNLAEINFFKPVLLHQKFIASNVFNFLMGIGEGCFDSGVLLALGAHCFAAFSALSGFGSKEQKKFWFPKFHHGEIVAAFGATESNAGSDVMAMETTYSIEEDCFILNGTKNFITNFSEANLYIIFATKNKKLHSRGISAFIVERNTDGITLGNEDKRMGVQRCSLGSIYLKNVKIPKSSLLGEIGHGNKIFQHCLMKERVLMFAGQVGIMRAQLEKCIAYAKGRKQGGKSIASYQFIIDKIVVIYQHYITSYLLAQDAMNKLADGKLSQGAASLLKLHISEAALVIHTNALRIHGAIGYLKDTGISDELSNSLVGITYSGTTELQKIVIASELGLLD